MPDDEAPCYRYQRQALTARFLVEHRDQGLVLVRCPVRRDVYILTPEERVRQALIWFLVEGSRAATDWKTSVCLEVEKRSIDIALYVSDKMMGVQFRPRIPVLIIETKRPESSLMEHVGQLRDYMLRERCCSGLLFNSRDAVWLAQSGDELTKKHLDDMHDIEARIGLSAAAAVARAAVHVSEFATASAGDFDALVSLVHAFGRDAGLTFDLSLRSKHSLGRVQAFSLQSAGKDTVTYRARNISTRNRQQFSRADFHALVSVLPL